MILLIILSSQRLHELVATIQTLPEGTQQAVGALMQEVAPEVTQNDAVDEHWRVDKDEQDSNKISSSSDPDWKAEVLQLEEQYAKVTSQLERQNQAFGKLEAEHQAVFENLEILQEANVCFQISV